MRIQLNPTVLCIITSYIFICRHQSFHFSLSDDAARTLPPDCQEPLDSIDLSKLTLTVYAESIAHDMAAYTSLKLKDLKVTVS